MSRMEPTAQGRDGGTGQPFREGESVLLVDTRGNRYLITLTSGRSFHSHRGSLPHDAILGQAEGCRVGSSSGRTFLALRPTLAEYILELPRITQVIYPKDLGAILMEADVFPGARVLEAGLGAGALTMVLLRAVGREGQVISYEARQDIVNRAVKNIRARFPSTPNHTIRLKDAYQGIEDADLDRVILDLPEPWRLVASVADALRPGGILLCYLPTVLQVHQLAQALAAEPRFDLSHTSEVLQRPWHVTSRSVRPDHRMVAHTGFLITARRCEPRPRGLGAEEGDVPLEGDESAAEGEGT